MSKTHLAFIREASIDDLKESMEAFKELYLASKLTIGEVFAIKNTIMSRGKELGLTIEDLNNINRRTKQWK